jgi:hypothetical protein
MTLSGRPKWHSGWARSRFYGSQLILFERKGSLRMKGTLTGRRGRRLISFDEACAVFAIFLK